MSVLRAVGIALIVVMPESSFAGDLPKPGSTAADLAAETTEAFEKERAKLYSQYEELFSKLNLAYAKNFDRLQEHFVGKLLLASKEQKVAGSEKALELAMRSIQSMTPNVSRPGSSRLQSHVDAPEDAVGFRGHRYKVFGKGLPFSGAVKRCNQLGGRLVVIESQEEFVFVSRLVEASQTNCKQYWVNGTDDMQEDSWCTVEGTPLKFLNWGEGEPSSSENQEHYLSINKADGWKYNDSQGVYRSYGFVCEWESR